MAQVQAELQADIDGRVIELKTLQDKLKRLSDELQVERGVDETDEVVVGVLINCGVVVGLG